MTSSSSPNREPDQRPVEAPRARLQLSYLIARWMNIRAGEGRCILLVTAAYFLVMGGAIIGRNARDALFIKNFGSQNLPYMYMASALLVIACAVIYASLVERMERHRFLTFAFLLSGGVLVASRLVLIAPPRWFYPTLWVISQAVSMVTGLLFWTGTEELFDTRQAKRLFPIVAVGGLLSLVACGFVTRPLVGMVGSANLFLVWVAMLVLTLLLLLAALRRFHLEAGAAPVKPRKEAEWTQTLKQGFSEVRSTRLLRAMTAIALANPVVAAIVDVQFFQVMNKVYPTADEMTSFLGTFRGLSGFCGLLIQVAGTPWLIATFGVGVAIAVQPLLMLLSTLGMLYSLSYGTAYAARFIDNTLFYTVQGSAFQLLYNPLPLDRRSRIRAFVEGYFRPLMGGAGGLLLVAGNQFLTPRQITLCAVLGAAGWLASSLNVRRGYIEALVENLGKASATQRLSAVAALAKIKDPHNLEWLAQAIRTAPAESAVPAILLLERFGQPETQRVLLDLLQHPEAQTRATAVAALGRLGNRALVAHLNRLLQDPDPRTRANAVEACELLDPALLRSGLEQYLDDPTGRLRANTLAVLTKLQERPASELLPHVEAMCRSPDPNLRASAGYALAAFPGTLAQPLLLELLQDPDTQPRLRALRSLEVVGNSECVPVLLRVVSKIKTLRREGRHTLLGIAAREPKETFQQVVAAMRSESNGAARLGAHLLGWLNRSDAFPHLIPVLSDEDPANREEALHAIERLARNHPPSAEARDSLEAFASAEMGRLEENLKRRRGLLALGVPSGEPREAATWLADEILGDNRWIRGRVLRAAALLHDTSRVREVARGVDDPDPRKRANALEALEYVVPGGLGQRLARGLELEAQQEGRVEDRHDEVLLELIRHKYRAVRAAAVLLAGRARREECSAAVEKSLLDPAPLVREAAVWAACRLLGALAPSRIEPMEQDHDLRVRRLVKLVLHRPAAQQDLARSGLQASAPARVVEPSMLLTVEKVLFLKSVPLFSSLEGEQLAGLADISEEIEVESDKVIFEAGEPGDELYLIVSGRLKVYRGRAGRPVVLAELGPGECFGEMALLDSEPRSASVVTLQPCRLLKISAKDFRELLYEWPRISMEIMKVLARRLRRMDVEMEERVRLEAVQQFM